MSTKTHSSRALKAVVIGIALEEGTRVARKYGPAVLDKMTEQAIEKGPDLFAKGWARAKTQVPPAAKKAKDIAAAASRRAVEGAKSRRRAKGGDQESTEAAPPTVPEDGAL